MRHSHVEKKRLLINGGTYLAKKLPYRKVNAIPIMLAIALLLTLIILVACGKKEKLRVGYSGGYLAAALYAAHDSLGVWADVQDFHSTSDIAYALILGRLDAGFVEAEKLAALAELDGFDKLAVAGKVTYPYGATLILRKGLNVRLDELNGLTVAASAPGCVLLDKFRGDAKRLSADISNIKDEYMVFDAMLPALESGAIDAAVIKGSYAVAALQSGHHILYQNWDIKPGDECCPAIIEQAALVLLARREKSVAAERFVSALESAQKLPPDALRRAVAEHTVIPYEILTGQPVPEFSRADDELLKTFIEAASHDHEDEEHGEHGEGE